MPFRNKPVHIRRNLDSYTDPYISAGNESELSRCIDCNAVYHNKRWYMDFKLPESHAGDFREVICPACRRIRDRHPGGIVKLQGNFLEEHREEIINLIRHEETNAISLNPLERIMEIEGSGQNMEITTTTEKLAQKIGKAVHSAYSGDIEYKWSEDVKLTRVYWYRNDEPGGKSKKR